MFVWLAINSVVILVLTVALFLTIRQVGILLGQVGPVGARQSTQGPRIGENVAAHVAPLYGEGGPPALPTLYVFGSESCAICASVRDAAEGLERYWSGRAALRLVYDEPAKQPRGAGGSAGGRVILWYDRDLRERLGIGLVPFGVMTDRSGEVIGKGIVNDVSQLESLLELVSRDRPSSARGSLAREWSGEGTGATAVNG